jgi:hypothetical protein
MKKIFLTGLALAAVLATPAFAQKACLQVDSIYSWTALDDKTLIVEDNWHKKFKVKLIGVCSNLKFHNALAFKSVGGMGISCLTPGDDVISHDFALGPQRCGVTSVDAYTPEMEAADKAAAAAKKAANGN